MKMMMLVFSVLLTSCSSLPQLYQAAEDIADDDAITVKVDKDAFQKDTDVNVIVEIKNQDNRS